MITEKESGLVDESKLEGVEISIFIKFLLMEKKRHRDDIMNIEKTILELQYNIRRKMTNLQTQIQNYKWKECQICNHDRKGFFNEWDKVIKKTAYPELCDCKGSGFEPMEIENPIWNGIYKYREDEIIKLDIPWEVLGCFPNYRGKLIKEFQIIKTNNKTGWGIIPIVEK